MGRMHTNGKGISQSALPYKRSPPSWLKVTAHEVEESVCKFARKGMSPSQIGVQLRDAQGIARVKSVTGNTVLRLLKKNGAWRGGSWCRGTGLNPYRVRVRRPRPRIARGPVPLD